MSDPDQSSPLWDAELERFILQRVQFRSTGTVLAPRLYFSELAGRVHMRDAEMFLPAGAKVGFNTYGNSFFASYWRTYTDIKAASLCGVIEGEATIYLFRSTPDGNSISLGEYPVSGVFHVNFDLFSHMPSDKGAGRFFFDFEARGPVKVKKLAFGAFVPPPQTALFSLGICTYRKVDYVTNLALALEAYIKSGGQALSQVIIVSNEGEDEIPPALQVLSERMPAFRVIGQDNIGGAGGFARTLRHGFADTTSTHHIFMDDDVFLDTAMLDRMQAFASYCTEPHVIGGQMMNMADPRMVYEGGARLDYWGFLQRIGENLDGALGADVSFFDKVQKVDYNAWWFAAVPKAEAAKVGLPLNIFIRGDDFEYGLRLGRENVETVSLPGLFLWHEPFEAKTADWLEYYNVRNRLIITALYANGEDFGILPANMLRDMVVDLLQRPRLEPLFAFMAGVLDFLAGPEAILDRHSEELHMALRDDLAALKTDPLAFTPRLDARLAELGASPTLLPLLELKQSARLGGRKRTAATIPWLGTHPVEILEKAVMLYHEKAEAVAKDWQDNAMTFTSEAKWSAIYGWPKKVK